MKPPDGRFMAQGQIKTPPCSDKSGHLLLKEKTGVTSPDLLSLPWRLRQWHAADGPTFT